MWKLPLTVNFWRTSKCILGKQVKIFEHDAYNLCFIDANGMSLVHKRKEKTYGFESVLIIIKDELLKIVKPSRDFCKYCSKTFIRLRLVNVGNLKFSFAAIRRTQEFGKLRDLPKKDC